MITSARIRRKSAMAPPLRMMMTIGLGLAGLVAQPNQASGDEQQIAPLWISCTIHSKEILVFSKMHHSRDGRGYVLIEEAERIRDTPVVRAAALELIRADYDEIISADFSFHLGAHVFVNASGEPLLAVDTATTPPALTISRPYQEGNRIYLGRTPRSPQTKSEAYYRTIADKLELLQPELAVLARRSLRLPPGTQLRNGFLDEKKK